MADIWMDVDAALGEVPVNVMPLIDATDFKTIEDSVAYNAAGMDLVWNFVTTSGAQTQTAVTPTTGGAYDWTNQGNGLYSIKIPASGGASINNDTEGFGWFSGVCDGVLPWRGPVIGFRASALNDSLIDAGTTGLLAPTTAARTLDVTAGGCAGVDWANVEAPTTTVGLSGTTIATTQKVDVETIKTNAVVNGGTVTFPTNATLASTTNITAAAGCAVSSIGNDVITAASIAANAIGASELAADAVAEIQSGLATSTALSTLQTTVDGLNDLSAAEVNTEVDTALADIHLDHLIAVADPGGIVANSSLLAKLVSKSATPAFSSYVNTTDSLEALRDRGDAAWATATSVTVSDKTGFELSATGVDAIWDEPMAAHTTDDTPGKILNMLTQDSVTLSTEVALNSIFGQLMDGGTSWTYDRTTDSLEVLGQSIADILTDTGTTLQAELDGIQALIGTPASTLAADIAGLNDITAADVWAAATRTLTAGTNIQLPSNGLANVTAWTVNITGNLSGSVGSLATQAKADVNAEVVDALNTDTYTEPSQGAPGATISLAAKLNWLYASWRNKKDNDGNTTNLYADNGTTVLAKQTTSSSGGTVTKAEWITGA